MREEGLEERKRRSIVSVEESMKDGCASLLIKLLASIYSLNRVVVREGYLNFISNRLMLPRGSLWNLRLRGLVSNSEDPASRERGGFLAFLAMTVCSVCTCWSRDSILWVLILSRRERREKLRTLA